ncbi:hypothetical protein D5R81_02165 [Parashewanella spongiae]|uniref:Uncharacterized protein n=1 Tax=Parashewanella spongiae TaxID=342950 RepID=A0A3A6UJ91_9GAMM|nr:hypothetical protein [Parashewanella spongiae]MCL1076929.1 hypothetical protein [Parashewanella spongiae]RJY19179.1 hypothetical protein D5R81_02165 [Parashewanella spongiae]
MTAISRSCDNNALFPEYAKGQDLLDSCQLSIDDRTYSLSLEDNTIVKPTGFSNFHGRKHNIEPVTPGGTKRLKASTPDAVCLATQRQRLGDALESAFCGDVSSLNQVIDEALFELEFGMLSNTSFGRPEEAQILEVELAYILIIKLQLECHHSYTTATAQAYHRFHIELLENFIGITGKPTDFNWDAHHLLSACGQTTHPLIVNQQDFVAWLSEHKEADWRKLSDTSLEKLDSVIADERESIKNGRSQLTQKEYYQEILLKQLDILHLQIRLSKLDGSISEQEVKLKTLCRQAYGLAYKERYEPPCFSKYRLYQDLKSMELFFQHERVRQTPPEDYKDFLELRSYAENLLSNNPTDGNIKAFYEDVSRKYFLRLAVRIANEYEPISEREIDSFVKERAANETRLGAEQLTAVDRRLLAEAEYKSAEYLSLRLSANMTTHFFEDDLSTIEKLYSSAAKHGILPSDEFLNQLTLLRIGRRCRVSISAHDIIEAKPELLKKQHYADVLLIPKDNVKLNALAEYREKLDTKLTYYSKMPFEDGLAEFLTLIQLVKQLSEHDEAYLPVLNKVIFESATFSYHCEKPIPEALITEAQTVWKLGKTELDEVLSLLSKHAVLQEIQNSNDRLLALDKFVSEIFVANRKSTYVLSPMPPKSGPINRLMCEKTFVGYGDQYLKRKYPPTNRVKEQILSELFYELTIDKVRALLTLGKDAVILEEHSEYIWHLFSVVTDHAMFKNIAFADHCMLELKIKVFAVVTQLLYDSPKHLYGWIDLYLMLTSEKRKSALESESVKYQLAERQLSGALIFASYSKEEVLLSELTQCLYQFIATYRSLNEYPPLEIVELYAKQIYTLLKTAPDDTCLDVHLMHLIPLLKRKLNWVHSSPSKQLVQVSWLIWTHLIKSQSKYEEERRGISKISQETGFSAVMAAISKANLLPMFGIKEV